jgi:hypothetical protein
VKPWAPSFPVYYVQDMTRPIPNFAIDRTKPEWAFILFMDFNSAVEYAIESKVERPESLRIESAEALRTILGEIRAVCPRIIKVSIRQEGKKARRKRIQDILKLLSSERKG